MLNEKCPECGHVLMWSVGKLKKHRVRRIFRRRFLAKVKYWYCGVGEGGNWDVPFCGCQNDAHKLHH